MITAADLPPVVLVVLLIEGLALAGQPTERRQRLGGSLAAGVGLVLAWMLASSTTLPWYVLLVPLSGALAAHVLDLRRRW
jgi:hypothetical protein